MTNPYSVIENVSRALRPADHGVVVSVACSPDPSYVIWAIGTDGRITSHTLDISCTDEARLQAHVEGFIENHVKAFAAAH